VVVVGCVGNVEKSVLFWKQLENF